MATYDTKKVLEELKSILKANSLHPTVTISELVPLAQLTGDITVDISLESVIYDQDSNSPGRSGYLRTFLISLHIGAKSENDVLRIYDVVDSLENSVLADNELWATVTDRDIATVVYDHAEFMPYRGATILMEARIRLQCD